MLHPWPEKIAKNSLKSSWAQKTNKRSNQSPLTLAQAQCKRITKDCTTQILLTMKKNQRIREQIKLLYSIKELFYVPIQSLDQASSLLSKPN